MANVYIIIISGLAGLAGSVILYAFGNKKERKLAKNVAASSVGLIIDDFQDFKADVLDRRYNLPENPNYHLRHPEFV